MNKNRKSYILSCEVSSVETVMLGGYPQKIAIEGKEKTLPVLICLHGGPGMPLPFSVGCRGLFPEITDRIIMVCWDQLGCGINNHKIDGSFTIGHFVDMTVDLIKEIRLRFPQNKLCLFGMSWGSILALHSALRVPGLLYGVGTYGQIVSVPLFSDAAFDAVEQSDAPPRQKSFASGLRAKRPDISIDEMAVLSRIVRKYTNGYINRASKPGDVAAIAKGLLFSPDYRLKDFIAVFQNGYTKYGCTQTENLMREIAACDFSAAFGDIAVPYHIFQGETDVVTDTGEVAGLLGKSGNGNVSCTVLQNAGHFPSESALREIFEKICQTAPLHG